MPGFSLLYDASDPLEDVRGTFLSALSLASHTERYSQRMVDAGAHCLLGWSAYPEYPIRALDLPGSVLLLDGVVYAPPETELFNQAERIDAEPNRCARMADWLKGWLAHCDAECVVVYIDRRPHGGAVIANDILGRLPVYWAQENGRVLVGREIKTMTPLLGTVEPDRQGVAETLHFGFPLGPRTLLDRITRLGPATVLRIDPSVGGAEHSFYHTWSFDDSDARGKPTADDVNRLVQSFIGACNRRAAAFPDHRRVLFLSGGLDSRAVAGGLARAGLGFDAITYIGGRENAEAESSIASRVATLLECRHETLTLHEPLPWDRQWSIELRDGLNYAALASLRQVYAHARDRWGDATLVFNGEGGDKAMPHLRPNHRVSTLRELTELIIGRAAMFDLRTVSRLTGLSRPQFLAEVQRTLDAYPERNLADRYVHFQVFERGYKWLFEGEERCRSQMWPTTPFYAGPFFEQAMAVPQRWKQSQRWYRDFLHALLPGLAAIPNSNTNQLPGSPTDRRREWVRQFLGRLPRIDSRVRRANRRRSLGHLDPADRWLPEPLERCDESAWMSKALDLRAVHGIIDRPPNRNEFWQLVTVFWYLQEIESTRWFGRQGG
jgi:asparagine synthase (glutamine-hydrolysing)